MKIVNGTPHTISIYAEADTVAAMGGRRLILKDGATPIKVIEEGSPLNAVKANKEAPKGGFSFPVKGAVIFSGADTIPKADLVIVSNLYRAACVELGRDTSRLGTVDGVVYGSEDAKRPCGCTAIAIG